MLISKNAKLLALAVLISALLLIMSSSLSAQKLLLKDDFEDGTIGEVPSSFEPGHQCPWNEDQEIILEVVEDPLNPGNKVLMRQSEGISPVVGYPFLFLH